jgi:transposase-like protein
MASKVERAARDASILRAYAAGSLTVVRIADEHGVSVQTVGTIARRAKTLRRRGLRVQPRDADIAAVRRRRANGAAIASLARDFGVSKATIWAWLEKPLPDDSP